MTPAPSNSRRPGVEWLIGLLVGVVFTALSARTWPLGTFLDGGVARDGATLRFASGWSLELLPLAGFGLLLVVIHVVRVLRWHWLLKPVATVGWRVLNRASAVGFMMQFLLPVRLGDLARPLRLSQQSPVSLSAALATVVVERVSDAVCVLLLLAGVLAALPSGTLGGMAAPLGWITAGVAAGTVLLVVAARQPGRVFGGIRRALARGAPRIEARLGPPLEDFGRGLDVLQRGDCLRPFAAWTLIDWLLNAAAYYVLALAIPELSVPPEAAVAMACFLALGLGLPNAPGNVGVFWYFLLLPLSLYDGDPTGAAAVGFGILAWAGQLGQQTLFGLWGLAADRFSPVPPPPPPPAAPA